MWKHGLRPAGALEYCRAITPAMRMIRETLASESMCTILAGAAASQAGAANLL